MKIYVDLDHVDITEYTQIESGEYNTNKINFIFTPEYKDLVKVAIFGCKLDTEEPKFYKVYLTDDSCYIPSEVLEISDVITIGCYGYKASGETLNLRYSPTPVKVIVYEGSFREGAENSSPLTPTEVEQIMSRIATLDDEVDDLDDRVTVLEGKACDVDSIKERVTDLEVDVDTINNKIDIIELDIDDLEGDIANTYSKTEVDTLLGAKVDTTTFNSSQAAQDEKIAKAELILSQLPKVTGEGTNISLSPTIEYDLEVGSLKGDTTQNTTNGYQLFNINAPITLEHAGITATCNNESGEISLSGTASGNAFIQFEIDLKSGNTVSIGNNNPTTNANVATRLLNHITNNTTSAGANCSVVNNYKTGTTLTEDMDRFQIRIQSGVTLSNFILKPMMELGNTNHSWEKYTAGASPNPNYPQDIQVVTGTQTLTISNSDNTETQTYTLHLGDLELAKIGSYQDYIYYDNGKWYKYGAIGKVIFTGNSGENWKIHGSIANWFYIDDLANCYTDNISSDYAMSNYYIQRKYTEVTSLTNGQFSLGLATGIVRRLVMKNTNCTTVEQYKTWLGTHNTEVRYVLETPTSTEITNTTLLSDLEYIRTHAMSYSGTTNISSNGNLPVVISASALKKLS